MLKSLTHTFERLYPSLPPLRGTLKRYYAGMVKRELSLLDSHQHAPASVLFIGGGGAPYSAQFFQHLSGARTDVIDHHPSRHKQAQRFIRTSDASMRCFLSDGRDIDLTPYDTIIIANQAFPKAALLSRVLSESNVGTHILVRANVKEALTHPIDSVHHTRRLTQSTLLYVRS